MPAAATARRRAAATQIIAGLHRTMRELRCLGSERLMRRGVSMGHLHVMSLLDAHGPIPMSRLADIIGVSLSNATGLVDRMEERDLVERVRMPGDRRIVHVRITDHGRQALGELELLRDDLMTGVLAGLTDDELDRLAAGLTDLGEAVERYVASDPGLTAGHRHGQPAATDPAGNPPAATAGRG